MKGMNNMKSAVANRTRTVLVVEDEPAIANVCRRVLNNEGLGVDIAPNGKVAQRMIDKKQYDSLLIDIRIPEMSGKELYQWLKRKHPQLREKIIFTTGDVISGDAQAFIEKSGVPFLPKPFTPRELVTIIRKSIK